ncbi:hypothetical protein AKG34_10150 [Peribacillus butanolivorans]|nr:hypothetical protein AKG34_10150 [Peribacillus butanolivorans]
MNECIPILSKFHLTPDDPYPNDHPAVLTDDHALSLIKRLAENEINVRFLLLLKRKKIFQY